MKTWVWALVAVAGGYLAYNTWFAPEGETPVSEGAPPPLEVSAPPDAPPAGGQANESAPPARPRIDLPAAGRAPEGSAPADDAAARQLQARREKALQTGESEEAARLGEEILASHPDSDAARWIHYERGREYLRMYREAGRNVDGLQYAQQALRELTPVLFLRDAHAGEKKALRDELAQLARDVFFTRHVEGVDRLYTPKRGDVLSRLSQKVFPGWGTKVSPGFIVSVNKLPGPAGLRAGEPIRVPLGEPSIVIVKSEFRLYYLFAGCYVRDYPVGLGRAGSTPEASFVIDELIRDPNWNPQPGVIIPHGDPRNILGSRWMGFRNSSDYRGFGIHGTSDPASIGKEASSGCVRMLRADVEELFEWTPRGTPVRILR